MNSISPTLTANEPRPLLYHGRCVLLDRDLAAAFGVSRSGLQRVLDAHQLCFPVGTMFSLPWADLIQSWPDDTGPEGECGISPTVFTESGAMILATLLRPRPRLVCLESVLRAFASPCPHRIPG